MRHELKYHISWGDATVLSNVLRGCLHHDHNADANGNYHIRSLYFDDIDNTALTDKVAGIRDRNKYRIRIYNYSDSQIRLERKSKRGDYIEKTSATITRRLADKLIAGDAQGLEKIDHPLIHDMYVQMTTRLLRPVVIVDYLRETFVHPAENTRITLDKNLRTGIMSHDLFNPDLHTIQALHPDTVILEVKYDNRLPGHLPALLGTVSAERSAISKYVICRQFEFSL